MSSILLTGGIGDVLALDAHMSDEERGGVREVWLATRAAPHVRELLAALPGWRVEQYHVVERDWAAGPVWEKRQLPEVPGRVADWSISVRFAEVLQGRRHYHGGTAYRTALCDTAHAEPVVIHPATTADRHHPRRLDDGEWQAVLDYLDRTGQRAAVIGAEDVPLPPGPLTNLLGRTSLLESVEIVKSAKVFVGVDSWASVVAAQDAGKKLAVKCDNLHGYRHQSIYYAPRAEFGFLTRKLTCESL